MPRKDKKPNPNQKVMRIHTPAYERIIQIANQRNTTPPNLIDEMLETYEFINKLPGRKEVIDAKV